MAHETQLRSVVKAVSWRLCGTLATMVVVLVFTGGHIDLSVKIGAAEMFFKLVVYYGHERFWDNISWGVTDE